MMMTTISPRRVARLALLPMMMLLALMMAHLPARALEEPPAVKLLLDFLRIELSVQPKVGSMRTENGDIVLSNVVLAEAREGGKPLLRAAAREIVLRGAAPKDGLMRYRQIVMHDFTLELAKKGEATPSALIRVPQMLLEEASILPRDQASNAREELAASQIISSSMAIPEIRFEVSGVEPFFWRDIRGTWRGDRRTGTGATKLDFGTLKVPLAALARLDKRNAKTLTETLDALQLREATISGSQTNNSEWLPDNRLLGNGETVLRLENGGELRLTLDKLAIPAALLGQLGRMRQQGQDTGADSKPPRIPGQQMLNDPQFMASLRMLTLNGFTLRWRDFGLMRRLIAWRAKGRGMTEEEYIAEELQKAQAQWGAMLPPALAQRIVRELGHFLQEPKSLRISMHGVAGQPIQLASLTMLLFMPQMVMQSVQVEVKANE